MSKYTNPDPHNAALLAGALVAALPFARKHGELKLRCWSKEGARGRDVEVWTAWIGKHQATREAPADALNEALRLAKNERYADEPLVIRKEPIT